MALSEHPILFDGSAVPWPQSWAEDNAPVESVFQTEGGTDQIIIKRRNKATIAWASNCNSALKARYEAYRDQNSIAVSTWNPSANAYTVRQMRMRGWKAEMVKDSDRTARTMGLWVVSFTLEEF